MSLQAPSTTYPLRLRPAPPSLKSPSSLSAKPSTILDPPAGNQRPGSSHTVVTRFSELLIMIVMVILVVWLKGSLWMRDIVVSMFKCVHCNVIWILIILNPWMRRIMRNGDQRVLWLKRKMKRLIRENEAVKGIIKVIGVGIFIECSS